MWNSHLPAERTDLTLQQALAPGMFNFLGKLCLDFFNGMYRVYHKELLKF